MPANGKVFGLCQERHRHQEWLKFLRLIDQTIPPDRQLHLICDNYATHKHPKVQRWLARHPRFHLHFTPTSGGLRYRPTMSSSFSANAGSLLILKASTRCGFNP
jgi:transposase